jgi:hypothetical protein
MTPDERVRRFLEAMTAWERDAYPTITNGLSTAGFDSSPDLAAAVAALQAIFDAHLTDKGKSDDRFGRRWANRRRIPVVQTPPQYDQVVASVESTSKKTTFHVVTTHRTIPASSWRYTVVVDASGEPRIDDLRGRVGASDWKRYSY